MDENEARQFRDALGTFATGITVVTASDTSGNPIAMTVNSFASVSLDPPLVLWSVNRAHEIFDEFAKAKHYAVHVLRHDQEHLSSHFSGDRPDKFNGVDFDRGKAQLPLLSDFCARFQCKVEHRYDGGDHLILVGRVLDMDYQPADPLVFHAGKYRSLG